VDVPQDIMNAFCDDVNTPLAIAHMHELLSSFNKSKDDELRARLKGQMLAAAEILGILQQDVETWFKGTSDTTSGLDETAIEDMIAARIEAKQNKDFAEADRIRKALDCEGITLEDGPTGTIWKRK